jgi:hypothetical protein
MVCKQANHPSDTVSKLNEICISISKLVITYSAICIAVRKVFSVG